MHTTILFGLLALTCMVAGPGCGGGLVALRDPGPVLVARQDPRQVREAILRALPQRSFTTESEGRQVVVARLDRGDIMLRLRISYGAEQFTIAYLDSSNLDYQVGEGHVQMISDRYQRLVRKLGERIRDELGRPERERQQAVGEQRRHELALRRVQADEQEAQRRHQLLERDAQRRHELARAQVEADARRPVIVDRNPVVVSGLAFNAGTSQRGRRVVRLVPGFRPDPTVLRGLAGGPRSSEQLGFPDACPGFFGRAVDHVLVLGDDFDYLRVEAVSDGDTTLAVVAPDGSVWCDGGSGGALPRIAGALPAGSYHVYVGDANGAERVPYRLRLTQHQAGEARAVAIEEAAPPPPPAPKSCRTLVIEAGHSPAAGIHCGGAEPRCAQALLRAGHSPAALIHCQGVDQDCAETLLRSGRSPGELIHCR
jgi:hypothetical protein